MTILFIFFLSYLAIFLYSIYTIRIEDAKIEYNKGLYFAAVTSFIISTCLGTIISVIS